MSNQILVPSLGESVTEATVSKWLKQVGEHVNADEPLVELETDKVNVEVPSPLNGTLSSISVKEGDSVEVGALLGIVADGKSKTKETKKSDLDKFHTERNAAQVMRDDLCFLVGWIKSDCPQGASAIERILKAHEQNREQDWL